MMNAIKVTDVTVQGITVPAAHEVTRTSTEIT